MFYPLLILSLWLHNLATVVMIGYYLLLSLVYLPYLNQEFSGVMVGMALEKISAHIRPWLGASLLVFIITGLYLMLGNEQYLGFGDFGNAWSVLMLVKHVLVLVMIGLSIFLNLALTKGLAAPAPLHNPHFEPWGRLQVIIHSLSISGLLVLLLTAMAQAR